MTGIWERQLNSYQTFKWSRSRRAIGFTKANRRHSSTSCEDSSSSSQIHPHLSRCMSRQARAVGDAVLLGSRKCPLLPWIR